VGVTGATGATGATGPSLALPQSATGGAATDNDATYANPPDNGADVSVTITTGTRALVIATGFVDTNCDAGYLSFAVSGATAQAATDARAVIREGSGVQASTSTVITNLTPGSNTFTLQYKGTGCGGGDTVTYNNRTISVIPLN
jgi:hypothetical protein